MSAPSTPGAKRFGLAHFIAFTAGIVFFGLSFVLLAILPGARLQASMDRDAPITMANYTPLEAKGRAIYAREGCDYCHTEQVRGTVADVERWGPATEPWETRYDYPQVWGTRRIGPDLAREGGVRSDDWQATHLYNPRWVVPGSIMPGYSWLFEKDAAHPTRAGDAVLAYMRTLGRAMRQAKSSIAFCPTPLAKIRVASLAAPTDTQKTDLPTAITIQDGMAMGGSIDANAAIRRLDAPFPALADGAPGPAPATRLAAGAAVFTQYCAGCHGESGAGDGPAAATLLPHPANLRLATYSNTALSQILWKGRPGTSMPAWRDLSKLELADVIAYVKSVHSADPAIEPPQTPQAQDDEIARGATVFAEGCVACHGVDGGGNGPVAHVFLPRPANLVDVKPNRARVLQVLAQGVPGASMPVFSGLSRSDQIAVAAYVETLYGSRRANGP